MTEAVQFAFVMGMGIGVVVGVIGGALIALSVAE